MGDDTDFFGCRIPDQEPSYKATDRVRRCLQRHVRFLGSGELKGRDFEFEPTPRSMVYDRALNQGGKQFVVARSVLKPDRGVFRQGDSTDAKSSD